MLTLKKVFLILGIAGLGLAAWVYYILFSSNTGSFTDKTFLYIPNFVVYASVQHL